VPFLEEVEDRESQNSHLVVEANLDGIPLTVGFDSQMPQVEYVESLNSHVVVEVNLDEIPSTSSVDSIVLHLLASELSPFHVIFYLNGVLITTCFNKRSCTIILRPKLKEFWRNVLCNSKSIFGL